MNLPTLYHPGLDERMIIETNASSHYWGAAIKARLADGREELCRYVSGSFQGPELNYIIVMKKNT